jgi:hypothetical protein
MSRDRRLALQLKRRAALSAWSPDSAAYDDPDASFTDADREEMADHERDRAEARELDAEMQREGC